MLTRGKLQYFVLEALNLKMSGSGQIRLIEAVPSGSAMGRWYLKVTGHEIEFKYFDKMNSSRSK
jgi:hypothetical protein